MNHLLRTNKALQILLSVTLSLSLLCTQGITLHVHNLDHAHGYDHAAEFSIHEHQSKPHFAYDTTHADHHDEIIVQYDVSEDGLFKTLTQIIFFPAFLAFLLILILRKVSKLSRQQEIRIPLRRLYLHSPPLRAPPQY